MCFFVQNLDYNNAAVRVLEFISRKIENYGEGCDRPKLQWRVGGVMDVAQTCLSSQ